MAGLLPHLGWACREARLGAGLRQLDISTAAGVSDATVSRFEQGLLWPRHADSLVSAYARETGKRELDLWAAALARWGIDDDI